MPTTTRHRHTASASSDADQLLGTIELSQWIGVPAGTLRNWRSKGCGPASFKVGNRTVYRRRAVEVWLASQEIATKRGGVE